MSKKRNIHALLFCLRNMRYLHFFPRLILWPTPRMPFVCKHSFNQHIFQSEKNLWHTSSLISTYLNQEVLFACIAKPFYKHKQVSSPENTSVQLLIFLHFLYLQKKISSMKFVKHIIWMKYHPQAYAEEILCSISLSPPQQHPSWCYPSVWWHTSGAFHISF